MTSHALHPSGGSAASPAYLAGTPTLRVDLLGPVEVSCRGADVTLSPLERNLLVVLALSPGVPVSTDRLIDALWGSRLPAAPRSRLQGLVSGLRRKVGDVVRTRHPGYLLDAGALERDLDECDAVVAAARETTDAAEQLRLLAAAQAVWRGEPLEGVSTPGVEPERARLAELRLSLLEARSEAELALGNHRSLVSLLAPAVAENPMREQLACLYITALYRSNRQSDALTAYDELRQRLADELGSDLCPELRELHTQILRGEGLSHAPADVLQPVPEPAHDAPVAAPAAVPVDVPVAVPVARVPAQLPPRDGLFLGRADELRQLSEELALGLGAGRAEGVPDVPGVVVVSGPGGLGKTALVVEWAHRAALAFPDGQLFLDVGGDRGPGDALAAALLALGVVAEDVPADLADRVSLYRAVVRDRRLLVVADDAGSVDSVLAVMPPGPGSRLVVTTRRRLVCLAAHHAVRELVPAPLSDCESATLLQRVVGAERLIDPARDELLGWCGGWPLLVRHAATQLAFRPSQSVTAFVRELEESPAGLVLHDDPRSVEAALAEAHATLTPAAARLFERLALHEGTICLHLAAVAAGTTVRGVRRLLDELTAAHLLVEEGSGHFRLHAVVGRFGRRLASEQEWTAPTCGDMVGLDWACAGCTESLRTPVDLGVELPVEAPVAG